MEATVVSIAEDGLACSLYNVEDVTVLYEWKTGPKSRVRLLSDRRGGARYHSCETDARVVPLFCH